MISDTGSPVPAEMGEDYVRDEFLPRGGAEAIPTSSDIDESNGYDAHLCEDCISFQIDMPQRVSPPRGINTPVRSRSMSRDKQIEAYFGPTAYHKQTEAHRRSRGCCESKTDCNALVPRIRAYSTKPSKSTNYFMSKIKDYSTIEKACRRAGKAKQEAYASYCKGILYDNISHIEKALSCYKHFYSICRKIGDIKGESIASNLCGVNCYYLAVGEEECAALTVGLCDGARKVDHSYIEEAIHFHKEHLSIATDEARFYAQTNLGLCYSKISKLEVAADYHNEALNEAVALGSPHFQSIAVGNIAVTMAKLGDNSSAQTFMKQHLKLVTDLKNGPAICLAYQQLGELARESGDSQSALLYYGEARCIAQKQRAEGMLKLVNCKLGAIQGSLRFQQYEQSLKF